MLALALLLIADPQPCKAAVLDLQAQQGIAQESAEVLTDVIASAVRGPLSCSVLSRTDIRALIGFEEERQLAGCESGSCAAEIGEALGVDRLIIGSIARLDERVVISLRLLDMHELAVLASVTDSYIGPDAGAVPFVQWLARRLVAGDDAAGPRPSVESRIVMERRMTPWRKLAVAGVGLSAVSGVAAVAFGAGLVAVESALPVQKTARPADRQQIEELEALGPQLAGGVNLSLYIGAACLLAAGVLFFLPAEELVEMTP